MREEFIRENSLDLSTVATATSDFLAIFEELNAISEEIEKCRLSALA